MSNIDVLVEAVEGAVLDEAERNAYPSTRIGYSALNDECDRKLVYKFRWAYRTRPFPARMLRLFGLGHAEEARIEKLLTDIGVHLRSTPLSEDCKPVEQRKQYRISGVGGHAVGYVDGVATNLSQWLLGTEDDEPFLLEYKTYNHKRFVPLQKNGVRKNDPKYYGQVIKYMEKVGLEHCLFCAVCKNDSELYFEYIKADVTGAKNLEMKAENIIHPVALPERIADSATDFRCRFCDFKTQCHGQNTVPRVNCRTCVFSKPTDTGTWSCTNPSNPYVFQMSTEFQLKGCQRHAFKPEFMPTNKVTFVKAFCTGTHVAYGINDSNVLLMNGEAINDAEDEAQAVELILAHNPDVEVLFTTSEDFLVNLQGVVDVVS